jgi:hypothetical protein
VSPSPVDASPLRVAHVVEALEVGGLEKLIVDFARHGDRGRFSATVVTLGERGRRLVLAHFTFAAQSQAYQTLFANLPRVHSRPVAAPLEARAL